MQVETDVFHRARGRFRELLLARIADTVDSETRTIKVSAELDNPGGRLRPEMYGSP